MNVESLVHGGPLHAWLAVFIVLISQSFLCTTAFAEDAADQTATITCDFADGNEITVEYNNSAMSEKDQPRNGRVWLPGGSPMTLFTQVPLMLNHVRPPGGGI